jgi:hypothetical protein
MIPRLGIEVRRLKFLRPRHTRPELRHEILSNTAWVTSLVTLNYHAYAKGASLRVETLYCARDQRIWRRPGNSGTFCPIDFVRDQCAFLS